MIANAGVGTVQRPLHESSSFSLSILQMIPTRVHSPGRRL